MAARSESLPKSPIHLKHLRHLLLAIVIGASPSFAAEDWRFVITPEGQPAVFLPLASLGKQACVHGLSLRHQLVFDGVRYVSRIVVPELESYLIPGEHDTFRWRFLGSPELRLQLGKYTKAQGVGWTVLHKYPTGYRVTADRPVYDIQFDGWIPTSAVLDTSTYSFDYDGIRLQRIRRTRPVEETVVTIVYDELGRMTGLEAAGRAYEFGYEAMHLTSYGQRGRPPIAKFHYTDDLLDGLVLAKKHWSYKWGMPKFDSYSNISGPLRPVVVSDDEFAYTLEVTPDGPIGGYRQLHGNAAGEWREDPATGTLIVDRKPARFVWRIVQ